MKKADTEELAKRKRTFLENIRSTLVEMKGIQNRMIVMLGLDEIPDPIDLSKIEIPSKLGLNKEGAELFDLDWGLFLLDGRLLNMAKKIEMIKKESGKRIKRRNRLNKRRAISRKNKKLVGRILCKLGRHRRMYIFNPSETNCSSTECVRCGEKQ